MGEEDFSDLNKLLDGILVLVPDFTVEETVLRIELNANFFNLTCSDLYVETIDFDHTTSNNNKYLGYTVKIIHVGISCSMTFEYDWGLFDGSSTVDINAPKNDVLIDFTFRSLSGFQRTPPNKAEVIMREAYFERSYISIEDILLDVLIENFKGIITNTMKKCWWV